MDGNFYHPRNLFFLTLGLVSFGVVMIYNASVVDALRDFGNKYHYFNNQIISAIIGIVIMLLISRVPLRLWQHWATPIWLASLFLLVIVLIPGIGSKYLGARRWLNLGFFSLQPAEVAKFANSLYLAAILSKKNTLTPLLVSLGLVLGLVMLEPDLGTSIVIIATSLLIYFVSGAPLKKLTLICLSLLVLGSFLILISPYRRARVATFINPQSDPQGSSYHIRQALIALGRGGFWGAGLGQSRQKYQYLPEVTTDSIFAIIGEEMGLLGTTAVSLSFAYFTFLSFSIAAKSSDEFARLLATGLGGWIAIQAAINLGAIIGLFPLTGVPLPFISYGGSSLMIALASVGVLLAISRKENTPYQPKLRKR